MATATGSSQSVGGGIGSSSHSWPQRGIGKSNSVLQTLLHRQLGFPYFSRNGDISYVVATRQLLISRAAAAEESRRPVKAVKVELKQQGKHGQHAWTQINVPEKTEIGITDTRIWTRKKVGSGRPNANAMAKEEFYCVEPSPSSSGLKCIKSLHSSVSGKIKKAFVISGRSFTSAKATTFFLTLMEPGILRAFDLVRNQVVDELKLPLKISLGLTSFKDMDVFDNSGKLFIIGSAKKITKTIILMNYPPWKEMGIVHVEIPKPTQIEMSQGACFFLQDKVLHVSTWAYLMKKVIKIGSDSSTTTNLNGLPSVKFEGRLTELPNILCKVHLDNEYYGLVDINTVPMFYGTVKSALKFFTFDEKPELVFEFHTNLGATEDPMNVFQFVDGSSRALICSSFSEERQLIEFKSKWDEINEENVVTVSKLNGFDFWEKPPQSASSTVTPSASGRRRRTCVNNNTTLSFNKMTVLGMTYCGEMDLIAVLTANEEEFQVAIYEPIKLSVVKALPPVYVWPRMRGSDDVNKKRESINNVEFVFECEFIFVNFQYSSDCKPIREAFFTRLLTEPGNQ